jgi:hypothetical protein
MKYSSLNLDTNNEVFEELLRVGEDKIFKVVPEGNKRNVKDMKDLYDVSVEDQTGKELLEKAHPEKGETIESYLTDGGLVENLTKQQETDMTIALKNPSGRVYKKTMAAKELADELVIIAEEMDIRGQTQLASYADDILFRLEKKSELQKEAVPVLVPLLIAVPSILAAIFTTSHAMDPVDFGVDGNIKSLVLAINTFKTNNPAGAKMFEYTLTDLNNICGGLLKTREQYKKLISQLDSSLKNIAPLPSRKDEIKAENISTLAESPDTKKIVEQINKYNDMYNSHMQKIIEALTTMQAALVENFKNVENMTQTDTGERGFWSDLWGNTVKLYDKSGKSDSQNLLDSLFALIKSLNAEVTTLKADKDELVRRYTSKLKYDISEQFTPETTPAK